MSPGKEKPCITAKDEFEKNPDLKQEDLDELREWMCTQKHLPEITEEMLIRFHHSCYYQLPATKDCIETYFTTRTNTPDLFTNRDVNQPALSKAMAALNLYISPVPDSNGNQVVYYGLREFEPSKYVQSEAMKVFFMTLDVELKETGTRPGVTVVYDLMGLKLGHLTRVHFSSLKKFFIYIQEGNPVRLKKIHFINVVPFIDKFMALMRPFMKKEFFDLLTFHTGGMDEFYDAIPLKCLPKELGGTLDSIDVLNAENTAKLASYTDFFLEDEKMRTDESKRDKRKKSKHSKTEPDIAFEKLEID